MRNILSNQEAIETVQTRILTLLKRRKNGWEGTMTELLDAISGRRTPEVFPTSATTLRRIVDRVVPSIRRQGYSVEFSRTNDRSRSRIVSFNRRSSKTDKVARVR